MRYNLVQIGDVYLTSDGTSSGTPCRVRVSNIGKLTSRYQGQVVKAADGTPYLQTIDSVGQGTDLDIVITAINLNELKSLINYIDQAVEESQLISVVISGLAGTFYLDCLPIYPQPIQIPEEFAHNRFENVTIRFSVVSKTEEESS